MSTLGWAIVRNKKGKLEVELAAFARMDGTSIVELVESSRAGQARVLALEEEARLEEKRRRGQKELFA